MQLQDQILEIINNAENIINECAYASIESDYGVIDITPDEQGKVIISLVNNNYNFELPVESITNLKLIEYLTQYDW